MKFSRGMPNQSQFGLLVHDGVSIKKVLVLTATRFAESTPLLTNLRPIPGARGL